MKQENEILQELEGAGCTLLAKDIRSNSYQIPPNYFELLPLELLEINKIASSPIEIMLPIAKPQNTMSLPDGYFDHFATKMLQQVHQMEQIVDNHKDNKALKEVYQLPADYFNTFEQQLFEAIGLRALPEEKLSEQMMALKNATAYSVPDQYFEKTAFEQKPIVKTNAKILPFEPVAPTDNVVQIARRSIKWAGWAAAAVVFIIFGIGAFQIMNTPESNVNTDFSNRIAQLPDERVKTWLNNHFDEFDINSMADFNLMVGADVKAYEELNQISPTQIKAYLESEAL